MKIVLPVQFVVNKFYQYSSKVKYHKMNNSYRGTCPTCHEGSSLGYKTRLNYYANDDLILCYNCQKTWNSLNWIKEVSGQTFRVIMEEVREGDYEHFESTNYDELVDSKPKSQQTLPYDSINLSDEIQVQYYSDNPIVCDAVKYIKNRRLDTAVNKCNLWLSLKDFLHKNRIVIPFHDSDNKIRFYQSRSMYKQDEKMGKYLSKLNADKTIFGLNNIDQNLNHLFIFEGPIDSMFTKNGISMGGLKISDHQNELLNEFFLYERIWVLDNQLDHPEVREKNIQLIKQGETVFIWPKEYKKYKDLNELCCDRKIDGVPSDFFIRNSYKDKWAIAQINLQSRNF